MLVTVECHGLTAENVVLSNEVLLWGITYLTTCQCEFFN